MGVTTRTATISPSAPPSASTASRKCCRDPDDEILFVDCNTSNDLPTFHRSHLRHADAEGQVAACVCSASGPHLYARLVGHTHLFATEPHTRNIAIRRSNPRNRWILSTNTDMIFVPSGDISSLADAVRDLPDGQYIAPRFELPEPLWEAFPRSDPQAVMRSCEELGPEVAPARSRAAGPLHAIRFAGRFSTHAAAGFIRHQRLRRTHDPRLARRFQHVQAPVPVLRQSNRKPDAPSERLSLRSYPRSHAAPSDGYQAGEQSAAIRLGRAKIRWRSIRPKPGARPNEADRGTGFRERSAGALHLRAESERLGGPQPADYPTDANDARNFVLLSRRNTR